MNITDYFADIFTNIKTGVLSLPSYAGSIFEFRQVPGLPISWLELILVILSCVILAIVIVGTPGQTSAPAPADISAVSTAISGGFRRRRRT